MVPLPGAAASALESYSRFLVSERARDRKIELEIAALKSAATRFSGTELYLGTRVEKSNFANSSP